MHAYMAGKRMIMSSVGEAEGSRAVPACHGYGAVSSLRPGPGRARDWPARQRGLRGRGVRPERVRQRLEAARAERALRTGVHSRVRLHPVQVRAHGAAVERRGRLRARYRAHHWRRARTCSGAYK